ncbi:hypothetical protein AN944_03149 [Shewanella sp. P1-14-1]|uniref:Uncharacterized protein n=1 Tax=Shewanella japonica TaxID=93973 RepID=A0ABN4YNM8_9GAMM|nr:hypothetical protein SJ2017_3890 [Shewanella japonica]KPZ69133.1 hypothetical protein AN944_03149 [Shewanella sp. P1-14-1]
MSALTFSGYKGLFFIRGNSQRQAAFFSVSIEAGLTDNSANKWVIDLATYVYKQIYKQIDIISVNI